MRNSIKFILFTLAVTALPLWAAKLTHPEDNVEFLRLADGTWLTTLQVSGVPLTLSHGEGNHFQESDWADYETLKADSQKDPNSPLEWALMDLDAHRMINSSAHPRRKIFGASVSKIYVAGAVLNKQAGRTTPSQLQLLADMLVISSNPAWFELQKQVGNGDSDRGRAGIHEFTQHLGYSRMRGFQGTWGTLHGNELTARELVEYLYDTYQGHYQGADTVWKLMHTTRTGAERGNKYLPRNQIVGGKTGTYDGESIDPNTGRATGPDGKPYMVQVRNQVLVFNLEGHEYGLAVLANTGSVDSAALLAGGIYMELAKRPKPGRRLLRNLIR
jgi:hypothetical protein